MSSKSETPTNLSTKQKTANGSSSNSGMTSAETNAKLKSKITASILGSNTDSSNYIKVQNPFLVTSGSGTKVVTRF